MLYVQLRLECCINISCVALHEFFICIPCMRSHLCLPPISCLDGQYSWHLSVGSLSCIFYPLFSSNYFNFNSIKVICML